MLDSCLAEPVQTVQTLLTMPADEFNTAVDAWQSGTVDEFSTSTGWQYRVSNDCSQPSLALQELSESDAAEILGDESNESDVFGAYDRVKFTDDSPEISVTVSSSSTNCNIAVNILHLSQNVRLNPPVLPIFSSNPSL